MRSLSVYDSCQWSGFLTLYLPWLRRGSSPYSIVVAYELAGAGSNGISQVRRSAVRPLILSLIHPQGAFVHFSERNLTDDTSTWIGVLLTSRSSLLITPIVSHHPLDSPRLMRHQFDGRL